MTRVKAGDWQRLGEMARRRRRELGRLSQAEVAQRGPMALDRVRLIESGASDRYRDGTLRALERALQWQTGSVEIVLAGGDPVPLAASPRLAAPPGGREGRRGPAGDTTELAEGVVELHSRPVEERTTRVIRVELPDGGGFITISTDRPLPQDAETWETWRRNLAAQVEMMERMARTQLDLQSARNPSDVSAGEHPRSAT